MRAPALIALLTATLVLAALPQTAALPPPPVPLGPILAITDGMDAGRDALLAAGYPECTLTNVGADCFTPVHASQFPVVPLAQSRVLFVPTHTPGILHDALVARATDIDAFLAAGGSLVAMAEPYGTRYEYVPNPSPIPFYVLPWADDAALVTSYGAMHPATSGVAMGQLDHWGPTFLRSFGERPGYLFPLVEGYRGEDVVLAGNHGAGCVLLSLLHADLTAAGRQNPMRDADAAAFLRGAMEWGLHCAIQPDFPLPYTGAVRIQRVAGGTPTFTWTSNLMCVTGSATGHYEARCVPTLPAPPGARWVCYGTTVAGLNGGVLVHRSELGCGSTDIASCDATQTQPACFATTALTIDEFPLRCIAKPGADATTVPSWTTTCGSFDP